MPFSFVQNNRKLLGSGHNMLSQTTNGFRVWKSNQHLHHLPLQSKNTSTDITSTQGASNYLTPELLDPSMNST